MYEYQGLIHAFGKRTQGEQLQRELDRIHRQTQSGCFP